MNHSFHAFGFPRVLYKYPFSFGFIRLPQGPGTSVELLVALHMFPSFPLVEKQY